METSKGKTNAHRPQGTPSYDGLEDGETSQRAKSGSDKRPVLFHEEVNAERQQNQADDAANDPALDSDIAVPLTHGPPGNYSPSGTFGFGLDPAEIHIRGEIEDAAVISPSAVGGFLSG